MKRLSIALSIAALCLPLFGQDKPAVTTTQNQDSPLVRAAKATKKTATKKSIVITNDNLMKSGGHIYIANPSPNPPASAAPQTESVSKIQADLRAKAEAEAKAKADAEAKANSKDSAAKREAKLRAAAEDYYGESIEERIDDPAMQEHVMNQNAPAQPQTVQPSKPPQQ